MPCVLEQWEIDSEEKRENKTKLGLDMTDSRVAEEVACTACRVLETKGLLKAQPQYLQRWWAEHKKRDRGRKKK